LLFVAVVILVKVHGRLLGHTCVLGRIAC